MSARARIAVLVAAVIVLVGGFVIAQSSDDDDDSASTTATTTPATTTTPASTTTNAETAPTGPPPVRIERIPMRDGGPAGAVRTVKYDSGETVVLRFSSNVADEVHVHGYDKEIEVPAGGAASLRFKANAEGVFEIESHKTDKLLAKLEVSP